MTTTTTLTTQTFDHLAIRASAGTGKTFQLTNRFLALLAAGECPSRILATTFTRKAAGEILDRVLHRLGEAALDDGKCAELAEHTGVTDLNPPRAMALLGGLARGLNRLQMCTLDSFFASVAGSFAMELGLPPGWRIVEPIVEQQLRAEAVRAVLSEEDPQQLVTLIRLLNRDYAARPVSQTLSNLVGDLYRLYVETPAAAWRQLSRPPMLPPHLLRAAVERLAAAQMPVNKDGSPPKPWLNAHRKAVEAARQHDWLGLFASGLVPKIVTGEDSFNRKPIEPHVVEAYQPLIEHARAALMNQLADRTEAIHRLLDRFDTEFTRLKTARQALRFEDVTRVLADGPVMGRLDEVYYRLDGRVAHLLLDEFQDTSPIQWRVLRSIAEEIASHADGERSLLCVGDVKQAIYGWRGGEAGIFDTLGRQLPSVRWEPLNKSFRSTQPIIDTVNRVFENLADNPAIDKYRPAAEAWAEGFEPHTTDKTALPGFTRMEVAPRVQEGGNQEHATLRHAARRIKQIVRDAPGRSIGVLLRQNNNSQIARLIYELSEDEDGGALPGVRASEEGGNPLTDSPAVMIALSLLKLADHPGDSAARFHVATSPLGPIVGLIRTDNGPGAKDEACRAALEIRTALVADGYGPTMRRWAEHLADRCDAHDLTRLMQLVELAHRYDGDATLRPGDFVRFIASQHVEDPTASDVRVMTIHRAKGLQFDVVVLPQLDGKLTGQPPQVVVDKPDGSPEAVRVCAYVNKDVRNALPPLKPMFDQHSVGVVREALSVLYVALTRPVHALHIILTPSAPNERTLPATFAGVLRAALTDGEPLDSDDSPAFEHGEPRWFEHIEGNHQPSAAPPPEPPKPQLAPCRRRSRNLPVQAPSQLQGGEQIDLAQRIRLGTAAARDYGSAIHALLGQVEWLGEAPLPDEALRAAVRAASAPRVGMRSVIERFHRLMEEPTIAETFSRAAYPAGADLVVRNEERFAVRIDNVMLSGVIDRLVLTMRDGRPVAAEVVDFKTDAIDAEDAAALDQAVAFYRPQVEAYRRAVERLYGLEPRSTRAKLIFVSAGVVREV